MLQSYLEKDVAMQLKPLTVGPIIGETTTSRVRIWGRGAPSVVDGGPRRCFGVVRFKVYGDDDSQYLKPRYFKMNPNFDMTGIAIIDRLTPNSYYEYQMGYFYSDVELMDAPAQDIEWEKSNYGYFKTASDDDAQPRTFAIGSCRYLLNTFFGDFFDDRGDKTFRSIIRQIENDEIEYDQLIMMGDQIYADDLNILNPAVTISEFYKRYRDAFSQQYLRKLMSQTSTYMTLDDHEIENNWPENSSSKDWKTLFPNAVHAYQTYQLSHSPVIPIRSGRLRGTLQKMWYKYTDGCCDIFVTDTRTERRLGSVDEREIISTQQMQGLKRWLNDGSGRVKIIVTSVPFFPDSSSSRDKDKWSHFAKQRQELLSYIDSRDIAKVVFFSGDVHASFSGELILPSGNKIITVISSAFFWPYPHPSARKFKLKGIIDGGSIGECVLANFSQVVGDDNFTKVKVTPSEIQLGVYERKGDLCHKMTHKF